MVLEKGNVVGGACIVVSHATEEFLRLIYMTLIGVFVKYDLRIGVYMNMT